MANMDIECRISENNKIKTEDAEMLVNDTILFKQEPINPDLENTLDNVYDNIHVLKEEFIESTSVMENFIENYVHNSNVETDVYHKIKLSELHKQRDLSEHEDNINCWDAEDNTMINIKIEHCQSVPLITADHTQTFSKSSLEESLKNGETSSETNTTKKSRFKYKKKQATLKKVKSGQGQKRKHVSETGFRCDVCKFKFTMFNNLKKHMIIHSGEKPFFCAICHSKFAWKGSLDVHMKSHTGEKPFSCDICNNKFVTKSNLTAHIRKHSGEKPFSCNLCKKKYFTKSSLDVHKRNHTGERPFPCNNCDMKFTTKNNLQNHTKNSHK